MHIGHCFAITFLLTAVAPSLPAQTEPSPRLRLFPLADGLRRDAPGDDLRRIGETPLAKEAAKVGLDLAAPAHPLLVSACRDDRLFYVFYKVVEEAFGDRPWILQRIKKTERTWAEPGAEPEVKETWQVEAFKTMAGTLKGADQHFGSFALRSAHRREVVKQYEIGFGEVPGRAEGVAWPFADDRLFEMLQPYGEDAALFEAVRFTASRTWTLTVAFDDTGKYTIRSDELGIDVPKQKLQASAARPTVDPASKAVVLAPGVGPKGIEVGVSTIAAVAAVLGAPLEDVPTTAGSRNLSYRGGLTCNFDGLGVLNTVMTRASFGGRTTQGVTHGMPRDQVRQKLGAPSDGGADSARWSWPGLGAEFDAEGRVVRLVVRRRN